MGEHQIGVPVGGITPYAPSEEEVDHLIARAKAHPLGVRFLLDGHLGSVAITFGTHAFTVDAARDRLAREGHPVE